MRDLYVSAFAPTLGSGRQLRTYTTIRALACLGEVDLVYVPFEGEEPSPEYQAVEGLRFHEVRPSRGLRRARTYVRARADGAPGQWARGCSPELVEAAIRMAAQPGRGRVIVGDPYIAAGLLDLARRRSIVYNAHNVESAHRHEDHARRWWTWRGVWRFERRLLQTAAETWMVSRTDMATASRLAPGAHLRYVPTAVDTEAIAPFPPKTGGNRILLLGNFAWAPNREGLLYFREQVLPLIWRERPEAVLRVVGRGLPPGLVAPDPRIEVAGFVDDLASAYAGVDCVVVPLLTGGGTPTKFVEALAYGIPVVATTSAAQALDLRADEHYVSADRPESFAEAVLAVLERGAPSRAAAGRAQVERAYSIRSIAERIAA